MDDTTLTQLVLDLPEKCIALMEDIDAAFHASVTRDNLTRQGQSPPVGDAQSPSPEKPGEVGASSRVTLSGLLNALDGIGAQEGRILYATTNCYDALDPALCRPGRMDVHVEFKLASKYQARELFKRFYMPSSPASEGSDEKDESELPDGADAEKVCGSEFGSISEDLIDFETPSSTLSTSISSISSDLTLAEKLASLPARPSSVPGLSRRQTHYLAARFASTIPEREFSMASLQGYLMMYKIRPHEAVASLGAWVEAQRVKKGGVSVGDKLPQGAT